MRNDRIEGDRQFNEKMTKRITDSISRQYDEELKETNENIQYFVASCIRQGVELKHDPDRRNIQVEKA